MRNNAQPKNERKEQEEEEEEKESDMAGRDSAASVDQPATRKSCDRARAYVIFLALG